MVGEAKVADATLSAQLGAPVDGTVLEIALREGLETAAADRVEKIVVNVVRLQEAQRRLEHLLAFLKRILLGCEIGQLGRNHVVLARGAAGLQGRAETRLRFASAIGRRRVEVIDTMLEHVLDLRVHLVLVDARLRITLLHPGVGMPTVHGRQTHRTIAKQRDLLAVNCKSSSHSLIIPTFEHERNLLRPSTTPPPPRGAGARSTSLPGNRARIRDLGGQAWQRQTSGPQSFRTAVRFVRSPACA